MKFVYSGGSLSLNATANHLDKYPNYLEQGNKYIIPKDFYKAVKDLLDLDETQAAKLTNSGGGYSRRNCLKVQDFFKERNITIDDIEPRNSTTTKCRKSQ